MSDARFNFSLKTLLIALMVLGVLLGLGGKLLRHDPHTFVDVVSALSLALPLIGGILTVLMLGVRERRPKLLAWAALLIATPVAGIVTAVVVDRMNVLQFGPSALAALSNAELLSVRLPAEIDDPGPWRELEARINSGLLTPQEVDQAINTLIAYMTSTRPSGRGQPLHWQDKFVSLAARSGLASQATMISLADAFYGPGPRVEHPDRLRVGDRQLALSVWYGNPGANSMDGLPRLAWSVKEVTLDGEPIQVKKDYANWDNWHGHPDPLPELAVGEHALSVTIAATYAPAEKLVGLTASVLTPRTLPQGIKQWEKTVTSTLTVHAAAAPLVKLLQKPGELADGHGIRIQRLFVQPLEGGRKKFVIVFEHQEVSGPDVSFDVALDLNGKIVTLPGPLYHVLRDGQSRQAGELLEAEVQSLPDDLEAADVVLTPNPVHVEHYPGVESIWGKRVVMPQVPMERLDRTVSEAAEAAGR